MSEEVKIRFGELSDVKHLVEWLLEPGVLRWFPMYNKLEVEDAAKIWASYAKYKALLTAEVNGEACGIANLYLQPYKKLSHHALFAIIVKEKFRGQGIGKKLVEELIDLAKNRFNMELLLLEVYEGNPAKRLYERMGFKQFGYQKNCIKEADGTYLGKFFMQRKL